MEAIKIESRGSSRILWVKVKQLRSAQKPRKFTETRTITKKSVKPYQQTNTYQIKDTKLLLEPHAFQNSQLLHMIDASAKV